MPGEAGQGGVPNCSAKCDAIETRNATPQAPAAGGREPQKKTEPAATIQVAAGSAGITPVVKTGQVAGTGFEGSGFHSGKTGGRAKHQREIQRCASGPGRGRRCVGAAASRRPSGDPRHRSSLARVKPGWATSDQELPEGVIGSLHGLQPTWTSSPGPHRPGRKLSLACLADSSTSAAPGSPSRTNSLTEKKACPTVDPRRGGGSFSKTLCEERTSESAQRLPWHS